MRVQLSSGQGPAECELAVGLLYEELKKEDEGLRLISRVQGRKKGGFSSICFESGRDYSDLEGSVLWICKSPCRPGHKRKNWYVDVSILEEIPRVPEGVWKNTGTGELKEGMVRFETFRCGGKGGQNVNKVETGVRVIHIPTGTAVVSTEARSQHQNRQIAMNRLCNILAEMNMEKSEKEKNLAWMEHTRLVRGNPVRIYEGMKFLRKE